ncbi:hypothetical protein [Coralloluteibacterium thermophilus]|uniref:Hemolysin XhlA n=1 Tax=Coralloluteibacterium thermophilum TaxID=2707049 RepID=A0ABV9NME2_9GAMM
MEARVAKLEAHVEHILEDVREIKQDVRGLRKDVAQEFSDVRGSISRMSEKADTRFVWLISAYGAGFMILLGVMAKGFGWV